MSILKFSYYKVKAFRKGFNLHEESTGFVVDLPGGEHVGPLKDTDMIEYLETH
jgi:hypothetical protein